MSLRLSTFIMLFEIITKTPSPDYLRSVRFARVKRTRAKRTVEANTAGKKSFAPRNCSVKAGKAPKKLNSSFEAFQYITKIFTVLVDSLLPALFVSNVHYQMSIIISVHLKSAFLSICIKLDAWLQTE